MDSNHQPTLYKSIALTFELLKHKSPIFFYRGAHCKEACSCLVIGRVASTVYHEVCREQTYWRKREDLNF